MLLFMLRVVFVSSSSISSSLQKQYLPGLGSVPRLFASCKTSRDDRDVEGSRLLKSFAGFRA